MINGTTTAMYFYIFCMWFTIGFGLFLFTEVIKAICELIRIRMITAGPCKACKSLYERVELIEKALHKEG